MPSSIGTNNLLSEDARPSIGRPRRTGGNIKRQAQGCISWEENISLAAPGSAVTAHHCSCCIQETTNLDIFSVSRALDTRPIGLIFPNTIDHTCV